MATFSQSLSTLPVLSGNIRFSADDTYDIGGPSGTTGNAAFLLKTVRLQASSDDQILVSSDDEVLRMSFDTSATGGFNPGSTSSLGTAINPWPVIYGGTIIASTNLRMATLRGIPAVQGDVYTSGTGVAMRLYVYDGIAWREFVPDV